MPARQDDGEGHDDRDGELMGTERYVLLGLAAARASWFSAVSRWVSSASLAAEFIKCVTPEEVRAHLLSGRAYSAVLVDASLPAFDRDLVATARSAATPVIAVSDLRAPAATAEHLGVAAVLRGDFGREELLDALEANARPVGNADRLPPTLSTDSIRPWRGTLVAVLGTGGTGASTMAIAAAQAGAADLRYSKRVVLADLALRADQAMLHDTGELGPGIQELVDAHRTGQPGAAAVASTTFDVPGRGYRLLLGLRRPSAWTALRPHSFDAALEGLRGAFQLVVADLTGDLEGEADCGSIDIEERNHMARQTVQTADAVVAVGAPGLKGIHSLTHLLRSAVAVGVSPSRLIPVINRSAKNPRSRAEASAALAKLIDRPMAVANPVTVPERRLEPAIRDGSTLPSAVVGPVGAALRAVLDRLADAPPAHAAPTPIQPGLLGTRPTSI